MKTAIYMRFSTDNQDLRMQKHEIDAYLQYKPQQNVEEYSDEAQSGKDTNRARFKDLLNDCKQGKVDKIIVYKLDRLSRSLSDLVKAFETFYMHKVKVISLQENIDFSTDLGQLFMHLLGSFAQFERATIRTRVKSGLAAANATGTQLGRPLKIGNTMKNKVRALHGQGMHINIISKELNISSWSTRKILKEESVQVLNKVSTNKSSI